MKKINITDELHEKIRIYSFVNKMTMKDLITQAIDNYLLNGKVVKGTSSNVLNTTSVLEDLDWTDREAQDLIDTETLKKFNI
jgi:hypothetical protein